MNSLTRKSLRVLLLSFILAVFSVIGVKAAAITSSQVLGTWDGEYLGSSNGVDTRRHLTIIFNSCDSSGNVKANLYIAAIPGVANQVTGSYYATGKANLSTGAVTLNPGSWIKTISSFTKSTWVGTFQISSKKLSGYRYADSSQKASKKYTFSLKKVSNSTTDNKLYYVSLTDTSKTIKEGESFTIKYAVSPNTITPSSVKWTSASSSIAKVDSNGKVTGVKAGSTTITCTASYNGSSVSAKCTVKVTAVTTKYKITGTVLSAANGAALSSAGIRIRSGSNNKTGTVIATLSTDKKGAYSITLPKGTYTLDFTKKGYQQHYYTLTLNANKKLTTKLAVQPTKYKITGTVRDAANGALLSGAGVKVRSGSNNKTGSVLTTAQTNKKGVFTLTLNKGNYTLAISKKGYVEYFVNVSLTGNKTLSIAISKAIASTKYRFVLSWGSTPADLDLYVTGPSTGSSRFTVYWKSKSFYQNSVYKALLDVDDRNGYGPETITLDLSKGISGTYRIYVRDYTNRNSRSTSAMASSGAKIDVYSGSSRIGSYTVPRKAGTTWTVCELVNGKLKTVNQVDYTSSVK